MVAAFGSGQSPHPNQRLTSEAPRLTVQALPGFGKSVTLTWTGAAAAPLTRVSRTAEGLVIETGGTTVRVVMRFWPMPTVRGRQRGIRWRFECPRCGTSRDVLHWCGEWGCRGSPGCEAQRAHLCDAWVLAGECADGPAHGGSEAA